MNEAQAYALLRTLRFFYIVDRYTTFAGDRRFLRCRLCGKKLHAEHKSIAYHFCRWHESAWIAASAWAMERVFERKPIIGEWVVRRFWPHYDKIPYKVVLNGKRTWYARE